MTSPGAQKDYGRGRRRKPASQAEGEEGVGLIAGDGGWLPRWA